MPQALPFGTLDAGTYRPVSFDVPMTFTVQAGMDGWASISQDRRWVELHAQRNAADSFVFALPSSFAVAGKGLLASLRSQGVSLSSESQVNVGGLAATEVEFVVTPAARVGGFGVLLFTMNTDSWFEAVGFHGRVTQVARGDGVLVIVVDAPSASEYAAVVTLADGVLASLHFD